MSFTVLSYKIKNTELEQTIERTNLIKTQILKRLSESKRRVGWRGGSGGICKLTMRRKSMGETACIEGERIRLCQKLYFFFRNCWKPSKIVQIKYYRRLFNLRAWKFRSIVTNREKKNHAHFSKTNVAGSLLVFDIIFY